ncbi:GntR family transcriptional regulator [Bradyrhizobium valentinum]|uniref:GntR family transcriptional regulator n=1 Tax=Bradyrhizobium valentinum TaxID=1518501 RepID=UPI00071040E9|nr:GntR family transcriptional regulator [Bradyrhizobium valentinum]KRR02339.1 GntR family transcriptional regulator [Bradyrhizobium valentinum]
MGVNTSSVLRLASPTSSSTQASTVYDRLREDLLSGRLEPGRKLQMRFLTEMYQTGQTPLREALNRLTADGLVECREQRGFYVADISRSELAELTKTRCWVESLALRESMAASTPQWEEQLLLAQHRLGRTPRSLNAEHFEDNPEWEKLHRVYHRTLIGNCGSQPLIAFCGQLADQLYRYRRLSIRKAFPSRHVADEHQAIMSAVLSGDADAAVILLTAHYNQTAEVILQDQRIFPELNINSEFA